MSDLNGWLSDEYHFSDDNSVGNPTDLPAQSVKPIMDKAKH